MAPRDCGPLDFDTTELGKMTETVSLDSLGALYFHLIIRKEDTLRLTSAGVQNASVEASGGPKITPS